MQIVFPLLSLVLPTFVFTTLINLFSLILWPLNPQRHLLVYILDF